MEITLAGKSYSEGGIDKDLERQLNALLTGMDNPTVSVLKIIGPQAVTMDDFIYFEKKVTFKIEGSSFLDSFNTEHIRSSSSTGSTPTRDSVGVAPIDVLDRRTASRIVAQEVLNAV